MLLNNITGILTHITDCLEIFHTILPLSQQKAVTLQPKTGRKIERIWIIQKQKIR